MISSNHWYFSLPVVSCFDGEGDGDGGTQTPPETQPTQTPTPPETKKLFTQDEVNALMANHRKSLQKQVEDLQKQVEASKSQDQQALLQKIEEMSLSLKTKEEQAREEQKKLQQKAALEREAIARERDEYKSELHRTLINHALMSAAVAGDAFSAEQVVTLLEKLTSLSDDRKVVVKGLYTLESGEPSAQTPEEAIRWMRDNPEKYGNLFKSNVVGGLGANSTPGGAGAGKKIDLHNLTPEQYRELREKNPAALGLNPR